MNRNESIAFFEKCEAARKVVLDDGKSENEAHEAFKAIWNAWAEGLLAEKKEIEDSGRWEVKHGVGQTPEAKKWLERARLDFTSIRFCLVSDKLKAKADGGHENSSQGHDDVGKSILCYGGTIDFQLLIIPGSVGFSNAQFHSDVRFNSVQFYSYSKFNNAQFHGYASFNSAQFHGYAEFDNAWFHSARLHSTAQFHSAQFHDDAWFNTAQFHGDAWFSNAQFHGDAKFNTALFHSDAWFNSAQFHGDAWFSNAKFHGNAWFNSALFHDNAWFHSAQFHDDAQFSKALFHDTTEFNSAQFHRNVMFIRSQFRGNATFNAIQSDVSFNLSNARFEKVPDFLSAKFKDEEPPNLENVHVKAMPFWSFGYNKNKDTAAKFRKLKKMAIQAHNSEGELEFHAQELRSNRFVHWRGWFVPMLLSPSFWFSLFYGLFSNFGRSVVRPMIAWIILTIVFSGCYLSYQPNLQKEFEKAQPVGLSDQFHTYSLVMLKAVLMDQPCLPLQKGYDLSTEINLKSTSAPAEALFLSLKNAFVFIDWDRPEAVRRNLGCLYGFERDGSNSVPIIPRSVSFANIVQNILSVILIFLFGLALRNMLKLK